PAALEPASAAPAALEPPAASGSLAPAAALASVFTGKPVAAVIRIVDEATERNVDLLVLGLPYRKRFGGDFVIGRTIPYVLQNAPCAVWVVREPMIEEPS
ncbi:MAG: universal stress protein, partial [Candidatus Limnocylindrales bacterium]